MQYLNRPICYINNFFPTIACVARSKYGKAVKRVFTDVNTRKCDIVFEDGTYISIGEIEVLPEEPIFKKSNMFFCMSCGEKKHGFDFDNQGRCSISSNQFWKRVRKVYWHRFIKNKRNDLKNDKLNLYPSL